jgi:formylglycine-generating enzyme required for sulfatase activity
MLHLSGLAVWRMKIATCFYAFLSLAASLSAGPVVSNLTSSQRTGTRLIDIAYDVEAVGFPAVTVRLEVSNDDGVTWSVPVSSVSGDVGNGVPVGVGRAIVWDAGADWPGNLNDQVRFRVTADDGFAYIPGGPFTMGRTSGDISFNAPPVNVSVKAFYLQKTETTKELWDEVRAWALENGYSDLHTGDGKLLNHPVQNVSWFDAIKWCNARSEMEGLTPCYSVDGDVLRTGTSDPVCNWGANGYRLPSEAEWEKAARGGVEGKRFPWGTDSVSHDQANFNNVGLETYSFGSEGFHPSYQDGNEPYTSQVGAFAPNGYGLSDMAGNVFEWCWDWMDAGYYTNGAVDPLGPASGTNRVSRGGSWFYEAARARCSYRLDSFPTHRHYNRGFRPARSKLISDFVVIPGGTFTMGRTSGDTDSNAPPVSVSVSTFYLNETETTKAQWDEIRAWALDHGYIDLPEGGGKGPNHPAHSVNWFDAVKWCNARSERDGLTPCYTVGGNVMRAGESESACDWTADGYRLPTEAEWEKAARGGLSGRRFPWGDTINHGNANYLANSTAYGYDISGHASDTYHPTYANGGTYTAPVAHFPANGFGLHDMAGNVWEWCWDWYDAGIYSEGAVDPRGPISGATRVFRGGSWSARAFSARSSNRVSDEPTITGSRNGFRTIRRMLQGSAAEITLPMQMDTRIPQTITFAAIPDQLTTDSVTLSATGGASGNPVVFTVSDGPGMLTDGELTFTTSGSVSITASQLGTANYLSAENLTRTFTVTKAIASLQFTDLIQAYDGSPKVVGLISNPTSVQPPVLYNGQVTPPSTPGSYAVSTLVDDPIYQGSASGELVIVAVTGGEGGLVGHGGVQTQVANGTDFGQVLLGGGVAIRPFTLHHPGSQPLVLNGSPAVGLEGDHAVDFAVTLLPHTPVLGNTSTAFEIRFAPSAPGLRTALVRLPIADFVGGSYAFAISGFARLPQMRTQSLVFNSPPAVYLNEDTVELIATASSGLPVKFRVLSGPATVTDHVLTLTGPGVVKVEATQVGTPNLAPARPVVRSIRVLAEPAGLTLAGLNQVYDGLPKPVTVLSSTGTVTVTYKVGGINTALAPSIAGRYPVQVRDDNQTRRGTLVIERATLNVLANDQTRWVGQPNPSLDLTFDGWQGGDSAATALLTPVRVSTSAKTTSAAGLYPITTRGGSAANYRLVHHPGTLLVRGFGGEYEALLRDPVSGSPTGKLSLNVPTSNRVFSGQLHLAELMTPLSLKGPMLLDLQQETASINHAITRSGLSYTIEIGMSRFGEMTANVSREGEWVAEAEDGMLLLAMARGQTAAHSGTYTGHLEAAEPVGPSAPRGAGWFAASTNRQGGLNFKGSLGDGTPFTASLPADQGMRAAFRLFAQPYRPRRLDSFIAGTFALEPHPDRSDAFFLPEAVMHWQKTGVTQDKSYRQGFGALTTVLKIDPWQRPSRSVSLATLLGVPTGQVEVTHDNTDSPSGAVLPTLVGLGSSNRLQVLEPVTSPLNIRKWQVVLQPRTGTYTGSFELVDPTQKRTIPFSGVLRQPPSGDDLVGAGRFLLPALNGSAVDKTRSGAMSFSRP